MIVTATAVPIIIEAIFNRVLSPFIKYQGIKLRPKAIEGPKTKEQQIQPNFQHAKVAAAENATNIRILAGKSSTLGVTIKIIDEIT